MRRHEPSGIEWTIEWSECFSSIATFVTSLPPLSTAPVSVAAAAAAVSWHTVKDILVEGSSWSSGGAVSIGALRLDCKQGGACHFECSFANLKHFKCFLPYDKL